MAAVVGELGIGLNPRARLTGNLLEDEKGGKTAHIALGVGWVSIIHDKDIAEPLCLPSHVAPIAYLCIGYVTYFLEKPELEAAEWLPRLSLNRLVFCDQWEKECEKFWPELVQEINTRKDF